MPRRRAKLPPRWAFSILMAGGFEACGMHLGLMRAEGLSTARVIVGSAPWVSSCYGGCSAGDRRLLREWGVVAQHRSPRAGHPDTRVHVAGL